MKKMWMACQPEVIGTTTANAGILFVVVVWHKIYVGGEAWESHDEAQTRCPNTVLSAYDARLATPVPTPSMPKLAATPVPLRLAADESLRTAADPVRTRFGKSV